jgi:hypothetical protein
MAAAATTPKMAISLIIGHSFMAPPSRRRLRPVHVLIV